jgi:PAS domain S-box-containing protein
MDLRDSSRWPTPDFVEHWLRLLIESLEEYAVFLVDPAGTITSWNPSVERVLGYPAIEFVGLPFAALFTPEDVAQGVPARELAQAAATGRSDDKRALVRKGGRLFRADGVLTAIRDAAGTLLAFSKVMHDVTAAHEAAAALRESEERGRLLVESISDYAIFSLDPAGHVTSWTRVAERMCGYRADAIIGQHFRVFFTAEDRARGVPEQELQGAVATGRVESEGWRVRQDGSRFWANEVVAPIRGDAGVRGFAKIIRDLTARQRDALEREHLLTQAQEANRLKDEFLGMVSHELRTPLNAILGWAHVLETEDLHLDVARQRHALRAIARNAAVQVRLVNDLLDVSRIISGKMRLQIGPTRLSAVVHAAVDAVQPAAQAKGVEVRVTSDPAAEIAADADRLQQIVWNLLANAIKFTPSGGRVEVETRADPHGTSLIVRDTGAGMAPEILPFVFDRFRQADSSPTRLYGGIGLGLAIVRHLVELHGGRVDAVSAGVGQGSTFTVWLPATATTAPVSTDAAPRASAAPVRDHAPTLAHLHVLVVDDDEDTREVLTHILSRSGAAVVAAPSAAQGLAAIEQRVPDVILADVGMPDEDGYAFLAQVRRRVPAHIAPAIAVTAFARPEDRQRALEAGYQRHLAKPLDPAAIVEAVSGLVRPPTSRAGP